MHVYPVADADTLHCSFQAVLVVVHLLESKQHPIIWLEHIQHWKWNKGSPCDDVGIPWLSWVKPRILSGLHCVYYVLYCVHICVYYIVVDGTSLVAACCGEILIP